MASRMSRLDAISWGLTGLALAVGVALWSRLPAKIAIHFAAGGTAGSYVPKTVGVVIPVVMVITWLTCDRAVRFDPPTPSGERAVTVAVASTLLVMAVLQVLVLGWNLGYAVPFTYVTVGIVLWGGVVAGYAFWRSKIVD